MKIFAVLLILACFGFFSFQYKIKDSSLSTEVGTHANYGFDIEIPEGYIREEIEPEEGLVALYSKSDSILVIYQFDRSDAYANFTKEQYIEARKKELNDPADQDEPGTTFEYVDGNIVVNSQGITLFQDEIKITTPDSVAFQLITSFINKGKFTQIVLSDSEKGFEKGKLDFKTLSDSLKVF